MPLSKLTEEERKHLYDNGLYTKAQLRSYYNFHNKQKVNGLSSLCNVCKRIYDKIKEDICSK